MSEEGLTHFFKRWNWIMHQSLSRKIMNLKTKCYFLVGYQLGSLVLLILSGIIWEAYSNDYVMFIAMMVFIVSSCIAIYKLYVNSTCPQCEKSFFYKGDNPANLGFSIYTHKCTNCGYKLNKGE
ncbi:hypothetical protein B9T26_13450 [Acinetobacter sp. ANC 4169]|nr:hypothetical protein B9T26_13450 [Acinetobacter sp. ANC 4169]